MPTKCFTHTITYQKSDKFWCAPIVMMDTQVCLQFSKSGGEPTKQNRQPVFHEAAGSCIRWSPFVAWDSVIMGSRLDHDKS